jgi:membrane-associated protein
VEFIKELYNIVTDENFLKNLIQWVGYPGLFLIIFAETGLLIGFFLPGDSLLVTAGLLASTALPNNPNETYLNIYILNLLLIPAAILGDATGYYIGYKAGTKLYSKPDSRFFKKEHLLKTKEFYEKHGGITIVIARFMPIIRTFAPTVAGIAQMTYFKFARYNVFGGLFWILSMTLIGYFLGNIPGIDKHIEKVIIIVVFLSISPAIYKYLQGLIKKRKKVPSENS